MEKLSQGQNAGASYIFLSTPGNSPNVKLRIWYGVREKLMRNCMVNQIKQASPNPQILLWKIISIQKIERIL